MQRAALIGDVVGSRHHGDRSSLQNRLRKALASTNRSIEALQPLVVTIGDEFQGMYRTMSDAIDAAFWLSVTLVGGADIRIGLGWGDLAFSDAERAPFDQDGPCWWRARDAIDLLLEREGSNQVSPSRRMMAITGTPLDPILNAYLGLQDELVERLDETDGAILIGMSAGSTQTEIARSLGINKSSVSRRATSHGLYTLLESRTLSLPELDDG